MAYQRKTSRATSGNKSGYSSGRSGTAPRRTGSSPKSGYAKPATRSVKAAKPAKAAQQTIRIEIVQAPENGVARPQFTARVVQPRKAQF